MKENRPDFSQYQFYKAEGTMSADTSRDPINHSTFLHYSRPIFQEQKLPSPTVFEPKVDQDHFTFHMRNLMQDYYHDILDNDEVPSEEKPELVTKIIRKSRIKGTKDSNEFRNKKLKKADKYLAQYKKQYADPAKYFEDNPPFVCDMSDERGNESYALLRGHHEMRRSGKYNIGEIPCQVITPDQLSDALNAYEPSKHIGRVTPDLVRKFLTSQMEISRESFQTARAMNTPISKPKY